MHCHQRYQLEDQSQSLRLSQPVQSPSIQLVDCHDGVKASFWEAGYDIWGL